MNQHKKGHWSIPPNTGFYWTGRYDQAHPDIPRLTGVKASLPRSRNPNITSYYDRVEFSAHLHTLLIYLNNFLVGKLQERSPAEQKSNLLMACASTVILDVGVPPWPVTTVLFFPRPLNMFPLRREEGSDRSCRLTQHPYETRLWIS
jgi:hypothetical protein